MSLFAAGDPDPDGVGIVLAGSMPHSAKAARCAPRRRRPRASSGVTRS